MAVFKVLKVQRALSGKLQADEELGRKHMTYRVYDDDGTFLGETYISHGASEIADPLLGQMARELNVAPVVWRDIIACSSLRGDYVKEARR